MSELKEKLYALCTQYVKARIAAAEHAIAEAQDAANNDTKSSAGDKYETSREMAQQETNRNLSQLTEASKLMVSLNHINTANTLTTADTGSLVITNNGNFYIAISAGTLALDGKNYFAISPGSPIGLMFRGKKTGEDFVLNGKSYKIEAIL